MQLSSDWHERTNVRLVDILSDVLKNLKPPNVKRPTHGYTIAEKEPEVVTAPGVYFPAKKGRVIPLKPRRDGGPVTGTGLGKRNEPTPSRTLHETVETLASYGPFVSRQNGGEVDTSLELPDFSRMDTYDFNKATEKAGLQGMAAYDASAARMRAAPTTSVALSAKTANSTKILPTQPAGLRSFMPSPPQFKENTKSPIFAADQKTAFNKKWKPYQDFWNSLREENTLLFPRDRGGVTSPDPLEGLSEEERKRRMELLKKEFPIESLASSHWTAEKEIATPNKEIIEPSKVETPKNLSEIKKEILPSGETHYTLPGTEGAATVGPERFFLGGKEVPTGTPGATSGDELARQRILKEAAPPPLKVRERTYYEAHPEERYIDMAAAETKPLMDTYRGLIEENRKRAGGFGLPMNPKEAAVIRAEAVKAGPELAKGLEQTIAFSQAMPERYYSADARVAAAEARAEASGKPQLVQNEQGEYVHIYPPGTTGGKPGVSRTGVIGKTTEKSPTELSLIAKAREVGSDGKPTPAAIEAKGQLDDVQKRKVELAEAQMDVKSKDIDIQGIADAVGEGQDARTAVKGSMGNPVASKVQSLVLKKYPKFNFNMSDANYKWKQSQTNQRTINFVGGSLPRVEALANQLGALENTDIPAINAVMRQISIQTGRPEYTNFESNRNAIVQEINTALSGSATGSDMRIKIELENLKSARSPEQIIGAVNNLREALIARLDVDLSDIYPIEVVQGKKTLEEYKRELFKKYRGKYGKPPEYETQVEGGNRPRAADFGGNPEEQKVKEPASEWDKFWK